MYILTPIADTCVRLLCICWMPQREQTYHRAISSMQVTTRKACCHAYRP